ncbi:MAG: MFS transporter [Blastochloris sp.]|nr:MFS transporter [Blastochloris sp.]
MADLPRNGAEVCHQCLFEPARSAIIPNVVTREELVAANGLSSTTWSAMLAIGAALGGLVAGTLGVQAAFIIDAGSFLLSAWLIGTTPVSETHHLSQPDGEPPAATIEALGQGVRYLLTTRDIIWYAAAKGMWNLGGGVLVLFTLFGQQVYPLGENGAISIGLLYAARGIGTGIGPLLALAIWGGAVPVMRRALGLSYFLSTAGYLLFSGTDVFLVALLLVMLAHMGGSVNWVYSTALLQIEVPDALRGRIFSIEYALLMFVTALSSYFTGLASDAGLSLQWLAVALSLTFLLPGCVLTLVLWRSRGASNDTR